MRKFLTGLVLSMSALVSIASPIKAEDNRAAAKIQDNSFLVEEAYNQEPGVIQHINTWRRLDSDWFYTFTEEWPLVTQDHQVSITVPYSWLRDQGNNESGFGDVQLNYRYQLSQETATRPAIAPRATVIIPSGSEKEELGSGSTGFQFNLPVSKVTSDRITLHGNVGFTRFLDVSGQSPTSYNVGASIIYAVSPDFNLMLEATEEWNESVSGIGQIDSDSALTISPGFRTAFNLEGGRQIVVGAAAPTRFEHTGTDYGVFLYLSIEHGAFFLPH